MKVDVSQPSVCKRKLDIEIPSEDVKKQFEEKLTHYQQTIQVRGFRRGKVPRNMVLSRFSSTIMGETVEDLINHSYEDACRQNHIVPVSRAKIDNVDYGDDKPLKFNAEVEIEPTVELKKYTGFGVKVEKVDVKDKDVNSVLEDLRERMAAFSKVERPSKKGDYIRYEYSKVFVGDKERKDYKNPSAPVPIGEAKIKEFNKALLGVKAGESINVCFKFPNDYEVEEVRGQNADFTIKVNEISEKKLPALDDEFAKKMGPYQNLEEMRARIRDDLTDNRKKQSQRKAQTEIIDKIIEANDIVVPKARIESYAENMYNEIAQRNRNIKKDEVIPRYREIGEREIKKYKILEWVAKTESIKGTQEEVDARIKEYADAHQEKFEDVKERFRKNGATLMIREDIREEKTLEWLVENNKK